MSQRNKFSRHQPASRADKCRQPYDLAGTAEQKTRNAYSAISSRPGNPTGMVAVIIPTFNERDNLEPIVSRVRTAVPAADVLVVDDNSPDGTGEIADELAVTDGHVFVLHQAGKAGIGAAYIAGFGWALDRGYGALVEMDADGSHDPAELPRLLHALEAADLVIGSRWVPGSAVPQLAQVAGDLVEGCEYLRAPNARPGRPGRYRRIPGVSRGHPAFDRR